MPRAQRKHRQQKCGDAEKLPQQVGANAPTMPIQLRATREPVSTDALLSDGSSGEYDASARKRRSAETHNRKPSSSLSRRLFVGLKIRAMNFIGNCVRHGRPRPRTDEVTPKPTQRQSQMIMANSYQFGNCRFWDGEPDSRPDGQHHYPVALHCRREFSRKLAQIFVRPQIPYCRAQMSG